MDCIQLHSIEGSKNMDIHPFQVNVNFCWIYSKELRPFSLPYSECIYTIRKFHCKNIFVGCHDPWKYSNPKNLYLEKFNIKIPHIMVVYSHRKTTIMPLLIELHMIPSILHIKGLECTWSQNLQRHVHTPISFITLVN